MKLSPHILNHWYPVAMVSGIGTDKASQLLGQPITIGKRGGAVFVDDGAGRPLPVIERFGHAWTSLGTPEKDLFTIPKPTHQADAMWIVAPCG